MKNMKDEFCQLVIFYMPACGGLTLYASTLKNKLGHLNHSQVNLIKNDTMKVEYSKSF